MANPHRGEIEAVLDGSPYRLCLTLGALAELEHQLAAGDILALVSRITSGKLRAKECIAIVGAGLRAGGYDVSDAQVARMTTPGGASGFIDIVARLLAATFGAHDDATSIEPSSSDRPPVRNFEAARAVIDPATPSPFRGAQ